MLQVVSLLCVGLYPNVCYHKEKRQLMTSDGRGALIHKSSINIIAKDPHFPSPYFVFGEKVNGKKYVLYITIEFTVFIFLWVGSLPSSDSCVYCLRSGLITIKKMQPLFYAKAITLHCT